MIPFRYCTSIFLSFHLILDSLEDIVCHVDLELEQLKEAVFICVTFEVF